MLSLLADSGLDGSALVTGKWQQGQWPAQWPYWNLWGVLMMLVPYSHHSFLAAWDKPPPAPESEQGAESEVGAAQQAPTPKEPSLEREGEPAPPPAVLLSSSSPEEAVAGPSQTGSPTHDFKEHQALLKGWLLI